MDFIIAKTGVPYGAKTGGGTITGMDQLDLLVDGAIAFIDQDSGLITAVAPQVDGVLVNVAMGTSKGSVLSSPIYKKTAAFTKTVTSPAAKKSMYIGSESTITYKLNLPATIVAGDEAIVELTNWKKPIENTSRVVTITVVMKGGETPTQVITAVAAAINADYRAKKFVLASASGIIGIKVEALTVDNDFFVAGYGILENADILAYQNVVNAGTTGVVKGYTAGLTIPVAFTPGVGLSTQMSKVEADASVYHGNINSEMYENYLWSVPTGVVAGVTYTQYYIEFTAPLVTPLIKEHNFKQTVVLAIPTSEAGVGLAGSAADLILAILAAN